MIKTILVLNAGSSSLKFAVYVDGADLPLLLKGSVNELDHAPRLQIGCPGEADFERVLGAGPMTPGDAIQVAFAELAERGLMDEIVAVGHRIVHGGRDFTSPVKVDAETLKRLRALVPLAPLHQPFNLAGVELAAARLPDAVQVAAFDTAFHATQSETTRRYALPRRLTEAGVVRYGFHGLSYQHVAAQLQHFDPEGRGGRVIAAHLGGGASLCAMRDGRSVASTMGFTALDGVPMGTRVGDLDPGAVLHLIQQLGMSPDEVARVLYEESGLLGVSGVSGDMKVLLESGDTRAAEAVDLFVYRIAREIGSLAAALGGLDTLVFTGGIGEHAATIRARVSELSAWLGVTTDPTTNARHSPRIDSGGPVVVRIVQADEERVLARAAARECT